MMGPMGLILGGPEPRGPHGVGAYGHLPRPLAAQKLKGARAEFSLFFRIFG